MRSRQIFAEDALEQPALVILSSHVSSKIDELSYSLCVKLETGNVYAVSDVRSFMMRNGLVSVRIAA